MEEANIEDVNIKDGNKKRKLYREYVEDDLRRRHIRKTVKTLVWLRNQKVMSLGVKEAAFENVTMEVGVLEKMIEEAGESEGL